MNQSAVPICFQRSDQSLWTFEASEGAIPIRCPGSQPFPYTISPALSILSNNQSSYADDQLSFLPNQPDPGLVDSISMVQVPLYLDNQVNLPISSGASIPLENSSSIMQEVGTLSQATVRKRSMWTEDEHRNFLLGMKIYGKGRWNLISKKVVRTKTSSEVASHAQKYFLRQNVSPDKRKRRSIHDITDADLSPPTVASTPACRISGGASSSLFTAAAATSYGTDRSGGVFPIRSVDEALFHYML